MRTVRSVSLFSTVMISEASRSTKEAFEGLELGGDLQAQF
jgi:hypothetical protein